jgi:hypothetical protein
MIDGLYQVTSERYKLCAGFVITHGQITMIAPILCRSFGYWMSIAVRIGD